MAYARNFDFYSPFMAAWIVQNPENPEGTRFPLWVEGVSTARRHELMHSGIGLDDDLQSLAFCTEISVELQLAYVPKITATLTPPFREGLAFLNSPLIEWGNSVLEVQFGYTGGSSGDAVLSPVFSGILLKPEITIGQDLSITLNAQGIGAFTGARQDWTKPFQNMTRRKIIEALAQYVGLEADFSEVDAPFEKEVAAASQQVFEAIGASLQEFQLDQATSRTLEEARRNIYKNSPLEQVVTVAPGGLTVWQIIYQLVREARCWMHIQGPSTPRSPEQLRIIPRNAVMTGPPQCTLVLYDIPDGEIGPARNTFPILGVSSPTSAIYLPSSTRGAFAFGYDSKERSKAVQFIDPNQRDVHRTGDAQTQANASPRNPALDLQKVEGAGVVSSDSLSPEYDEQIRAETESAATNMGVKLEIDTLAIPDLLPAHVVAVRGIGARFESGSGNYAVLKLTHTFGNSGASSKIEAVSNVGQLASVYDTETLPTTPVNDKKPTEFPDNSTNLKSPVPARGRRG